MLFIEWKCHFALVYGLTQRVEEKESVEKNELYARMSNKRKINLFDFEFDTNIVEKRSFSLFACHVKCGEDIFKLKFLLINTFICLCKRPDE